MGLERRVAGQAEGAQVEAEHVVLGVVGVEVHDDEHDVVPVLGVLRVGEDRVVVGGVELDVAQLVEGRVAAADRR